MDNNFYWPRVDDEKTTDKIEPFMEELKKSLKVAYDGKIDCTFEKVEYTGISFLNTLTSINVLPKQMILDPQKETCEVKKTEVKLPKLKEYKYVIFNEDYFFRIFDVQFGAYFPIKIRPTSGICDTSDYIRVNSQEEFENVVRSYINSQYVKNVIRYMKSEDKR